MMKKLYLFIIAFATITSFAQVQRDYSSVSFYKNVNTNYVSGQKSITAYTVFEDFNGGTFPPAGWTIQSPDGGSGWSSVAVGTSPVPGWQGGTITDPDASSVGNVAFCTWNTGGAASNDQYLITPQISISNGDGLNFWMQRWPEDYADNVDILLSTTGNAVADFTVTLENVVFPAGSGGEVWVEYNYDLSAYDGQQIYIAFREHVTDNVNDGASVSIDNVKVGQPDPDDAALSYLTINPYVVLGNVDITGVIKNVGQNAITAIDVSWSDGTNTYTDNLTGLNIASGATYNFTHSTQLNVSTAVLYNITAWVDLVGDSNSGNDTATATVSGVTSIPTKKVIGEEAGGTWCGWCVRGIVALKDMQHNYPDSWIGIAVHNGDPMVVADYDGNMNVSGYPSGYVDRAGGETDPSDFETAYGNRINMVAPAGIEVVNATWNAGTNTYSFDVKATFVTELSGEYRLNAVVTEDNVTGTTTDWDQENYYSSASYDIDLIDWEGINYRNLAATIPAADMVYNDVARAILGTFQGTAGSVPSHVVAGDVATYSYSYTVPSGEKPEDMHLIGMIIDANTGEILNGDMVEVVTNVNTIENNTSINVYPNPSTGIVNIKGAENSTIEILNSLGVVIKTINNTSNMEVINLSGFENGTYIVRVISDSNTIIKKISLVK